MQSKRRRRRLTLEEKEGIIAYRKAGRSYTEVSVLMGGVPLSTIERYIKGKRKPAKPLPVRVSPETVADSSSGYAWEEMPRENYIRLFEAMGAKYSALEEMINALMKAAGPANEAVKRNIREDTAMMWAAGFGRKGPVDWMELVKLSIQLKASSRRETNWADAILAMMMNNVIGRLDDLSLRLGNMGATLEEIRSGVNTLRLK